MVGTGRRYWSKEASRKGQFDPGESTYHDPCNVGRKLGVYEPPRKLLMAMAEDFVELWPNRNTVFAAEGSGASGRTRAWDKRGLNMHVRKRDQILRSEATIVATSCQNCLSQLGDLQSRYDMPIEVKS